MAKRYAIEGHTVQARRGNRGSGPSWLVRDQDGVLVGSVSVSASTNSTAFCASSSGSWHVTVHGPAFFVYREAHAEMASHDSYLYGQKAAREAGHVWTKFGNCYVAADGISSGRACVREEAWAILTRMVLDKATV